MDTLPSAESETTEFKERWTDRGLEDLAAFSNHRGGELYVGVRDDGTVVGFGSDDGDDEEQQRVVNQISDRLHITPQFDVQEFTNRSVLVIKVSRARGQLVPYRGRYLTRVGTTNRVMTTEEIGRRMLESAGRTWDILPSSVGIDAIENDLVIRFIELSKERLPKIRLDSPPQRILQNLQLLQEDRLRNAGVLLFTSTPQAIYPHVRVRIGRFKNSEILDSHEIEGSLWDTLDKAMQKLRDILAVRFDVTVKEPSLKGLQRQEVWEYPLEALREALINTLIHRDYAAPGDIQIRVYDDRLTIWNPGGLPEGIRLEQLYEPEHHSVLRNPLIAQVFHYAELIEKWGTGTTRMIKHCEAQGLPKPIFEEPEGAGFRVVFTKDMYSPDQLKKLGLPERQLRIIQAVKERGQVQLGDLKTILTELSTSTIQREVKSLIDQGLLRSIGEKKGRRYELAR